LISEGRAIPMPSEAKRGPSYPAFGLSEAVVKARLVFDVHGKRQVHADEAVQTWGYKGLSGPSARALAGLRHYGLLDGTNSALRLSSVALAILVEDEDSDDRAEALATAARQPKVFQELLAQFPVAGGLPSDGSLRAYLLKSTNFSHTAATEIVESFRDSVSLAKLYESPDIRGRNETKGADSGESGQPPAVFAKARLPMQPAQGVEIRDLTIPLVGGAMAVLRVPLPLSGQNFQLIQSMLEAMKQAITVEQPAAPTQVAEIPE